MTTGRELSQADMVYEALVHAILSRDLFPGTKLAEQTLAGLFGVSRIIIRAGLNRLHSEGLVEFKPNRGAFVASPSLDEAILVFDTRTVLEREVAYRLGSAISKEQLKQLNHHLKLQRRTHRKEGGSPTMHLAEAFHLMMARMAGNAVLEAMLARLIARTSLALALYGRHNVSECGIDEHAEIVGAFRDKDPELASNLMKEHLDRVFRRAVSVGKVNDSRTLGEALAAHIQGARTRAGLRVARTARRFRGTRPVSRKSA